MYTCHDFTNPPQDWRPQVVRVQRVERHEDRDAKAVKVYGFGADGGRCFYFHSYFMTEERFDCDDDFYEVPTYFERIVAWRLLDGRWLRQKIQAHHLAECGRGVESGPLEVVDEAVLLA